MSKTLYRSTSNRVIAGVCAGIANYFAIDPVIVRIIFVIAALVSQGVAILVYLALWVFVPEEGTDSGDTVFNRIAMDAKLPKEEASAGKNRRRSDKQPAVNRGSTLAALVLVVIGLIFLVSNFVPGLDWTKLWPVLLIVIGLGILLSNRQTIGIGIGLLVLLILLILYLGQHTNWHYWQSIAGSAGNGLAQIQVERY